MQPLEIDSAVFCDGARYTIISRENSSILTCPVASGAGGYTLNRVEGRDIDLELDRLTGHAACIAVDVPTWCRIAGDPLDAVADALADLLCETPTRFELERRPRDAGPRRQEGRGIDRAGRGRRARAGALVAALPVREHALTRRVRVPIIRAISASPAPSARRTA